MRLMARMTQSRPERTRRSARACITWRGSPDPLSSGGLASQTRNQSPLPSATPRRYDPPERRPSMSEERASRRLAAILAGDIVGYSRLMGIDEEGTLRQLKLHRRELVDPKILEHR